MKTPVLDAWLADVDGPRRRALSISVVADQRVEAVAVEYEQGAITSKLAGYGATTLAALSMLDRKLALASVPPGDFVTRVRRVMGPERRGDAGAPWTLPTRGGEVCVSLSGTKPELVVRARGDAGVALARLLVNEARAGKDD